MSYFGSIYADMELPHRAKAVYMYLKDRSNAGDTCWPSVRTIAADLKLSSRTVQRALTDLEHHGFLERTHRRRPNGSLTSNLYRVK
jgi:lexA DNA binding domain